MKFKHLLLTGLLTTVAAVLLLTLVVPRTAEAGGGQYYTITCSNGGIFPEIVPNLHLAKGLCGKVDPQCSIYYEDAIVVKVTTLKGRVVCEI